MLNTLVLKGRADENRGELKRQGRLADDRNQLFGADLLTFQELLGQIVVEVGQSFDQFIACLQAGFPDVLGAGFFANVLAVVAVEVDGLHGQQVDDALELVLGSDRVSDQVSVVVQFVAQHLHHAEGVGARTVHLVDEGQSRHTVALHLAVDGDRLRLHTGHCTQHQDGAVEHAQSALHLDGEVDVARGVDQVDIVVAPDAVGGGRLDGDALLALEIHGVHGGTHTGLALHLFDLVDFPGVEEDALGKGGFPRVDVGRDPDIADLGDV